MRRAIILLALLIPAAHAAPKAGAPKLKFAGIYDSGDVRKALVLDGPHPYVLTPGTNFGPYQVRKLFEDQLTLNEDGVDYTLKLPKKASTAVEAPITKLLPHASTFHLQLADVRTSAALKLLAEGTDNDYILSADTPETPLTVDGQYTTDKAFALILANAKADATIDNGLAVVAPAATLPKVTEAAHANLALLSGAATKACTADFTYCDLRYFLDVIGAQEGNLKLDPTLRPGSVTCRFRNRPAAELVAWALAAQLPPATLSKDKDTYTYR